MTKRYFAVGAAKGWVQIRSAKRPPVVEVSENMTTVKQGRLTWDERAFDYVMRYTPRRMKLKVTTFKGGRTLWTVKASKLGRLLGVGVREGGMVELMAEQVEAGREAVKSGW